MLLISNGEKILSNVNAVVRGQVIVKIAHFRLPLHRPHPGGPHHRAKVPVTPCWALFVYPWFTGWWEWFEYIDLRRKLEGKACLQLLKSSAWYWRGICKYSYLLYFVSYWYDGDTSADSWPGTTLWRRLQPCRWELISNLNVGRCHIKTVAASAWPWSIKICKL